MTSTTSEIKRLTTDSSSIICSVEQSLSIEATGQLKQLPTFDRYSLNIFTPPVCNVLEGGGYSGLPEWVFLGAGCFFSGQESFCRYNNWMDLCYQHSPPNRHRATSTNPFKGNQSHCCLQGEHIACYMLR